MNKHQDLVNYLYEFLTQIPTLSTIYNNELYETSVHIFRNSKR